MIHFHALTEAVRHNCLITDARHARSMTMCTYLLEMQQYYRWENGIPYSASLKKSDVGSWLIEREKLWGEVENLPYSPLPIGDEVDPFDAGSVNRLIVPEGYVYGAGYGRFGKPHFFLGKLLKMERRGNCTILVSSCEYARDLNAPAAALQNDTIFVRRDAVCRMIWEQAGLWTGEAGSGCSDVLDELVEKQCESIILHELGEGMAGELLGGQWEELLSTAPVKAEVVMRAVRDLLADCLSTLPQLLEKGDECLLRLYFDNLSGMRKALFPLLLAAYHEWLERGEMDRLLEAVEKGRKHWAAVAGEILSDQNGHALAEKGNFSL